MFFVRFKNLIVPQTHIQQLLLDVGFLDATNPGQTMTRLRRLLTRVAPDATEVQMLRGILKELGRAGDSDSE